MLPTPGIRWPPLVSQTQHFLSHRLDGISCFQCGMTVSRFDYIHYGIIKRKRKKGSSYLQWVSGGKYSGPNWTSGSTLAIRTGPPVRQHQLTLHPALSLMKLYFQVRCRMLQTKYRQLHIAVLLTLISPRRLCRDEQVGNLNNFSVLTGK